eukprot:1152405-Pelagomonas_calceolata.AAC.1
MLAKHCLDGRAEQDSVGHAFKAGYIIAGCSFLTNIGRLGPCRAPSCEALDIANVEEVLPWNLSRFQLCATKISPWTLQVANAYRLRAKDPKPLKKTPNLMQQVVRYGVLVVKTRVHASAHLAVDASRNALLPFAVVSLVMSRVLLAGPQSDPVSNSPMRMEPHASYHYLGHFASHFTHLASQAAELSSRRQPHVYGAPCLMPVTRSLCQSFHTSCKPDHRVIQPKTAPCVWGPVPHTSN